MKKVNSTSQIVKSPLFLAILMCFLSILIGWALLTKFGYIPNFLGIEILCSDESKQDTVNPDSDSFDENMIIEKPVIYLYPESKTNVMVQLEYEGKIVADYPNYNQNINGWSVIAYPEGRIINLEDNKEYSYIFWEGIPSKAIKWDLSTGFVVRGEDSKEFLQEKLAQIGLTPREYNEFIVYWYPQMQDNEYNLVHFAQSQYTDNAKLTINPTPDSILRVFMVFKPLEKPIKVEEQKLSGFERKGFTVVEWGGTKVD